MPSDDPVRVALRAAEDAWRYSPGGTGVPAAIAAFLRALPDHMMLPPSRYSAPLFLTHARERIATAIEAAAKEPTDAA